MSIPQHLEVEVSVSEPDVCMEEFVRCAAEQTLRMGTVKEMSLGRLGPHS